MKLNQKKILSLVLALVMILTTAFMAFNTYAEDAEPDAAGEEAVVEEAAEEVPEAAEEAPAEEAPEEEELQAEEAPVSEEDAAQEEDADVDVVPAEEFGENTPEKGAHAEEAEDAPLAEDEELVDGKIDETPVEEAASPDEEVVEYGTLWDGYTANRFLAEGDELPPPESGKKLYNNGDGTYTLSLSVTGTASSNTTQDVSKANVILVLDTSSSMNTDASNNTYYSVIGTPGDPADEGNVTPTYYRQTDTGYSQLYYRNGSWYTTQNGNTEYTGTFYTRTRMWAEKHALTDNDAIIDSLLSQNEAGDSVKNDIIEIALVTFDGYGRQTQDFTTNAALLKNTINGMHTASGTNWEEALQKANAYAADIKKDQPKEDIYVIFITDGEPTCREGVNTVGNNIDRNAMWTAASDDAHQVITDGNTFYALYTWGNSNYTHYLTSLVQYAYTGAGNYNTTLASDYEKYFTNATSTEALIEALNQIVHDITTGVGYTDVGMTDGVTEMTDSNLKISANGDVSGLKYYRSGGKYGEANPDAGNYGTEWTDAPKATINDKGEVEWKLNSDEVDEDGNPIPLVLENGVTYTMTFVVWPKQESFDLVADLNNGVKNYNDLSVEEKAQISGPEGGPYTLKTNTDYPTLTYSTITTTTVDGQTSSVVIEAEPIQLTNPPPVSLAEDKLNAVKAWEDSLDPSQREDIKEVTLYLLVDGEYYYVDSAGKPMGVKLHDKTDEDPDDYEPWTETNYISIAPGLFVTEDSPAYDPDAPQFTYDGITYAMIEKGHEYVFEESQTDHHYELTAYTHHPMIMGYENGKPLVKDVIFTKDANGNLTGIEKIARMGDNISATNTMKPGINISKVVVDENGNEIALDNIPDEDTFTMKVHLTDVDGNALPTKTATNGTTFTIDYRIYYGPKNPAYDPEVDPESPQYDEEKAKTKQNRTGHIYVTGTEFEETIYVGDVIRVVNIENGAIFYVEETLPNGSKYALDNIAYTIAYGKETPTAYTDDDIVEIEGQSWYPVKGNSASYAVVTNNIPAYFYVYHSSDNTIEKIPVDDDRVDVNGKFNLVEEVKPYHLYGGYYKAYSGAKMTDAEIIAADYTATGSSGGVYTDDPMTGGKWITDESGCSNYTGGKATAWSKTNAYKDEAGLAITPKVSTVYYLKELPNSYIRPYIHIVYDENNPDHPVEQLRMITGIDDANYTEVGFYYTEGSASVEKADDDGRLATVVKVSKNGTVVRQLNAKGLFVANKYEDNNKAVPRGYVTLVNVSSSISKDNSFKMLPYCKTLDGVMVFGITERTVYLGNTTFIDENEDGIGDFEGDGIYTDDDQITPNVKAVE